MAALPGPEDLLAIAHLVRTHGVWGEINAIRLAPPVLDATALVLGRRLLARDAQGKVREMRVDSVRPHQDRWLIHIEGVTSMEEAAALRGLDLCLTRAELPPLPEGWYWEDDLQRCRVIDRTLGDIGGVRGLNVSITQPQLEVLRPEGTVAWIPWIRAFVREVNLQSGEIQVDLPAEFPGVSSRADHV